MDLIEQAPPEILEEQFAHRYPSGTPLNSPVNTSGLSTGNQPTPLPAPTMEEKQPPRRMDQREEDTSEQENEGEVTHEQRTSKANAPDETLPLIMNTGALLPVQAARRGMIVARPTWRDCLDTYQLMEH